MEVVHEEVDKDKLTSEPSVLDFLEEGVVEPGDVGPRLVFEGVFPRVSVSGFVTEHNVELDKVEVVSGGEVVEHHEAGKLVGVKVLVGKDNVVGLVGKVKDGPEDVSPNS